MNTFDLVAGDVCIAFLAGISESNSFAIDVIDDFDMQHFTGVSLQFIEDLDVIRRRVQNMQGNRSIHVIVCRQIDR